MNSESKYKDSNKFQKILCWFF